MYFIFARFCEFQKLFKEIEAKELLKEENKGADVNEGRFVLNIDVLFAL
jgi:glucose-6-phosphate isomerase